MSEINNNGFNPPKDINIKHGSSFDSANSSKVKYNAEKQQVDASSPAAAALGQSMVKIDNLDTDLQRLLENPKLAESSDKLFNAALASGVAYPEAATFATTEIV